MRKMLFIFIIILAGCGHKKIKGDRDIETPTSPGKKSGLTMYPESIGFGRKQQKKLRKYYPDYNQNHNKVIDNENKRK
ncbi:MAG TPA: hypothetical protein VNW99_03595 [Cytophagaceae bacterium]|nr:hypothetical protein [Cytophagaceae bacterium]